MIVTKYLKRKGDDPAAEVLLKRLKSEGIDDLGMIHMERVFRLEGISKNDADRLHPLLCDSVVEEITDHSQLNSSDGPVFEVGYQRAVTDPELPSILRGAGALGVKGLEWARISHRYQFIGLNTKNAKKIVEHYLFNPQVQHLIHDEDIWTTLKPQGEAGPVEHISLLGLSENELTELSEERRLFLNKDQMKSLQQIEENLGRTLTDAEVECSPKPGRITVFIPHGKVSDFSKRFRTARIKSIIRLCFLLLKTMPRLWPFMTDGH